jgi:hypothetical protein
VVVVGVKGPLSRPEAGLDLLSPGPAGAVGTDLASGSGRAGDEGRPNATKGRGCP